MFDTSIMLYVRYVRNFLEIEIGSGMRPNRLRQISNGESSCGCALMPHHDVLALIEASCGYYFIRWIKGDGL